MMMNILITGASGFIGTNLLDFYLRKENCRVLNIDALTPKNPLHKDYWVEADIYKNTQEELNEIVKSFNPDYVFHLAARTDLDGMDIDSYKSNTMGVEKIIKACQQSGNVKRIGFASSRLVCEIGYQPTHDEDYLPSTFYGESKIEGERLVRKYGEEIPEWFIFRPTSIWGPWFGVPYLNFFLMVNRGLYFHPFGKLIEKSFGYVENSVFQLDKLMFAPKELINKKMFYLCDYPPLELSHWGAMIAKKMGVSSPNKLPMPLLIIAAKIGDLLKIAGIKNPPLTSFRLNNLITNMTYDTKALEEICGKLPFSLEQGVDTTVDWLKTNKYVE